MKKSVKRLTSVILALAICLAMCVGISAESVSICGHGTGFPSGTICTGSIFRHIDGGIVYCRANAGTYHDWFEVFAEIHVDPFTTTGAYINGPNNVQAFSREVQFSAPDIRDFIEGYHVECSHGVFEWR